MIRGVDNKQNKLVQKPIYKKKYRLERYYLRLPFKITFLVVLILALFSLATVSLLKGLNTVTIYQFFYTENSNLDYKICLKENNYFSEKCLDKDRQYIASLIDYIDAEFKYNFSASDLFDYNYMYYVTAKVVANEKGDTKRILYNKEEVILEKKEVTMNNSNSFVIKENLNIDYSKYNNLMTAFRKDYTLILESKLVVTLYIELYGNYNNIEKDITTKQEIVLTIPLSEQTINIEANYKDINNSEVVKKEINNSTINILFYVLSGICSLLGLLVLINLLKLIKKTKSKSLYDKKLKKILREYNQIIVDTKTTPILKNQRVIDVRSFEELVDAKEAIGRPILYIKIHDQKSYFIISSGDEVYRFILKAADLEK